MASALKTLRSAPESTTEGATKVQPTRPLLYRGSADRFCPRCETTKPLAAFDTRTVRGEIRPASYCKPCMVSYNAEWRHGIGREKHLAKQERAKGRYPEREAARNIVARAIAAKRLERGTACELEGSDCSGILEAHHDDYSKPLEVRWVCRGHHRRLDRERQAAFPAAFQAPRRGSFGGGVLGRDAGVAR